VRSFDERSESGAEGIMDGRQIDTLAWVAATSRGRRGMLRLLAGALLTGAVGASGGRAAEAGARCFIRGKRCRYDRQCCSRDCRFGSCR
jgi:hypothetical protein